MEKTKAERLAFTLNFLVREGKVPGLLPKDVTAAADLLCEQEKELALLRTALATKHHVVTATAERENYRLRVRGEFVIADPCIYFGEIAVNDETMFAAPNRDWELHVARQLKRAATADWVKDMEERAIVAVHAAIAAATRRAKTPKAVECGASQSGGEAASPSPSPSPAAGR